MISGSFPRIAIGLVMLAALTFACSGSKPPPAMSADQPLASEVPDDPDAMAAAFGSSSGAPSSDADGGTTTASTEPSAGDSTGAKTLIAQFLDPSADAVALTRSLRPTSADYAALFDAATAPKVEQSQAKDWDSGKAAIKAGPGQTEVKLFGATGADLAAGTGDAKEFPKEYRKFAKHLIATLTYYRFKFVKPGEDTGTAYDGLAFINGHWVIAPKPYRALAGKSGLDDSGDDPTKKKPKKKKKKAAPP